MTVIIGMDPHKRSATIEVVDDLGMVLAAGRYGTDKARYTEMLAAGRKWSERVRAVEGCNGIGRHIAHRLVHDGETVLDVPAKLSAQCGCSPPAMDARPTRWMHTRWRWSLCGPRTWSRCSSIQTWW